MKFKTPMTRLGFVAASAALALGAWAAPAQAHPWAAWIGYGQPNDRIGVACFQDIFNDVWWQTNYHPIAEDGVFGPDTDGAIRAFQKWKHLPVDGIVGPNTGDALLSITDYWSEDSSTRGCDYYIPSN
ncbi:peptidoglycan-binding domain-containing protein [Streptomyces sp. LMG1-1-1.1]|uniref:peptidoglycan-binding domain-containing protein n=1 Tax=Streptomyces sp. LMG1-1-1.1 TaxID=3135245 RepID=UPI003465DF10